MIDDGDEILKHWLDRWAAWMRFNASEYPSTPSTASGFSNAVSNYAVATEDPSDYWDLCVSPKVVAAIDAAIDSLHPCQRQAIWLHYGLCRESPEGCTTFPEAFIAVRLLVLSRVAIAA